MIYCISDIHGEYEAWKTMLKKIRFSDADTMYVLGDMVDRGPKPLDLLKDILARPNVIALAGNHELSAAMLLKYLIFGGRQEDLDDRKMLDILLWQQDGGASTLAQFSQLSVVDRTQVVAELSELELFAEVSVAGRDYILVHAGLGNADVFDPARPIEDYDIEDLLWTRMDYSKQYYADKYIVSGHTPTRVIQRESAFSGAEVSGDQDRIIKMNNHIAIDCGCTFGGKLACICLDTLDEFYV